MIYTIGRQSAYEQGLTELGAGFKKAGRGEVINGKVCGGGSVWETRAEAEAYAEQVSDRMGFKHAAYGVLADWKADTIHVDDEPFNRLMTTAQIVRLD